MRGHWLFDRFGFNLPKAYEKATKISSLANYNEWVFDLKQSDWINPETEVALTGYCLPPELDAIMSGNVDVGRQ